MSAAIRKRLLSLILPLLCLSSCGAPSAPGQGTGISSSAVGPAGEPLPTEPTEEPLSSGTTEAPLSGEGGSSEDAPRSFEALFRDGTRCAFERSDDEPEDYFLSNFRSFVGLTREDIAEPMGNDLVNPVLVFNFRIDRLPASFSVAAHCLYETPSSSRITEVAKLGLERDGEAATVQTNYRESHYHHRTMYLYSLTDGVERYYLGVYLGGHYLDPEEVADLRIPKEGVARIDVVYTRTTMLNNEDTETEVLTGSFDDDEAKGLYAEIFVDPLIVVTTAVTRFWQMDGHQQADFTIVKTNGEEESFSFCPFSTNEFIYRGTSYYMNDGMSTFASTLIHRMRNS